VVDSSVHGNDIEVAHRWACHPRSVARARAQLRHTLADWGLAAVEDQALLVLSELMSNAVRHARVPVGRRIETRYAPAAGGGIRIEVHDAAAGLPQVRHPDDDDETGRGLALVDVITGGRWGVSPREGAGKRVWALVAGPGAVIGADAVAGAEPPDADRADP
jgi:serine/threonine-protein kinase RsbW